MSKMFFFKLGAASLKKNSRAYFPYLLTAVFTIAMFYIMIFLATNPWVAENVTVAFLMKLGTVIIALFSAVFLFYTNSFLIKRRKKEIGLYNILGMEKKHIGRLLAIEMLYIALIGIVSGLAVGILLSKLTMMLLAKILGFNIGITFTVSGLSVGVTVLLFFAIFAVTLFFNLFRIHLSNPVELLSGGNVGEREPKTKFLLAAIGVVSLGSGYYIAITTESVSAFVLFFVAVILVIIGTYTLFAAGSVAVLKLMRKNKNYYYKANHFTAVSGMLYRMKQNAVGLANICVLSTMVLVMISGTSSLFLGFDGALRNQYPRNISIEANDINEATQTILYEKTENLCSEAGYAMKDAVSCRYADMVLRKIDGKFVKKDLDYYDYETLLFCFIPLSEYNKTENKIATLGKNEVIVYARGVSVGETLELGDMCFEVAEKVKMSNPVGDFFSILDSCTVVMADDNCIAELFTHLYDKPFNGMSVFIGFDMDCEDGSQIELRDKLEASASDGTVEYSKLDVQSSAKAKDMFYQGYGGLFFLGVCLGLLFVMATVLIIYYKQISEGSDDKRRFEIMQQVGMSREEVKKTIHSQVLTVFFLPLVTSIMHLIFAFPILTKLLSMLNLTNVLLFVNCTIVTVVVFALLYAAVYAMTARAYYRIIQ